MKQATQEIKIGGPSPHIGRIFPIPYDVRNARPVHWAHLVNFFSAVRNPKTVKLNCPGEDGYRTAVSVLRVNDCLAAGGTPLEIKPEEYVVG